MKTDEADEQLIAQHDRNVAIVSDSVAGLLPRFVANGMTPVGLFEGAIKGAVLAMMSTGSSAGDVADLLEEAVDELRRIHGAAKTMN